MEEANEFLALNGRVAVRSALAVLLGVFSPVFLIFLPGLPLVYGDLPLYLGMGMVVTLIMGAAAVALTIYNSMGPGKYAYLEKEEIETAYGVSGMVRDRMEKYSPKHTARFVAGVLFPVVMSIVSRFRRNS